VETTTTTPIHVIVDAAPSGSASWSDWAAIAAADAAILLVGLTAWYVRETRRMVEQMKLARDAEAQREQDCLEAEEQKRRREDLDETRRVAYITVAAALGMPHTEATGTVVNALGFFDQLLPAICLYAEEVTRTGGTTIFADTRKAHDRLPTDLRDRLAGLEAMHLYDYANDYGDHRFRVATAAPEAPRATHPVVLPHATTGRPLLYVNRLMTDSIVGLGDAESEALLDELMTFFEGDEVRYVHTWRVHDLVVWDNLALQHGRTDFPPTERRCLRRVQIG
jgi:hypothetical protein